MLRARAYLRCPVQCLCKSVILENKAWNGVESDPENARYYLVVVQYISKLDTEKLRGLVRDLKSGESQLSKKKFNFQLADEHTSYELSGFKHNAVTPVGMRHPVPVFFPLTIDGIDHLEQGDCGHVRGRILLGRRRSGLEAVGEHEGVHRGVPSVYHGLHQPERV